MGLAIVGLVWQKLPPGHPCVFDKPSPPDASARRPYLNSYAEKKQKVESRKQKTQSLLATEEGSNLGTAGRFGNRR